MAYLSLSLLGAFQAWTSNGSLQTLRTLKERALLAYLAVEHGKPHRRETLAELFWPERREGIARNNLRQALYGIRQAIGSTGFDAIFNVSNEEVQVNLSEDLWLDLVAFEVHRKAYQYHSHNHPSLETCPYCLQHLSSAVEIYRGSFLQDVFLDTNQEYCDWVTVRREEYFRQQIQALEALVREYENMGDYAQAVQYATRLVQLDDLKESQYRWLMSLLAHTGRGIAALEVYERCRRKLADVQGGVLDEQTVTLAEKIREGRFDPISSPVRQTVHNLPEHLTPFIGREMELARIGQALEDPTNRLVSLVGPGGVGKTRLAVQSARINLHLFPDGVYFVSLEAIREVSRLVEIMGRTIGLTPGSEQDMRAIMLDYLRSRHILFVLDDFEHLLEARELVLDILQAAPFVKILVASRERLRLQAEYLVDLRGLSYPAATKGKEIEEGGKEAEDQALQTDAVQLLYERAGRVRSNDSTDSRGQAQHPNELAAAVQICQLVEGLPLGIELAASWARDYSFSQIAEEVRRNLEFLSTSFQDLPERHRSLWASFEHSWDMLSESEREVFCKLAVFPGSFSVRAALEVSGAAQPWLMVLEDKSLVRRAGLGSYSLHPLLRQYAGHKLRQYSRRVEEQANQQHAQFFCAFLKDRELDLMGSRQADALSEIEADLENIFAAWDWAAEHQAYDLIDQASFGLLLYLETRSRWREGEERFRKALASLWRNGKDVSSAPVATRQVLAHLMSGQGWFSCRLTQFQAADDLFQQSLRLMGDEENSSHRVFTHFALGFLYIWMNRFNEAWLHLSTALSMAQQIGAPWEVAWSRELLAEIAYESGQSGYSADPFRETLALFERVGDLRGSSRALNYLGNIALAQGNHLDARSYFEKLLANVDRIGDVWGAAGGYSKLGQLATARGAYEQAWRFYRRSLAMLQKMGDQRRTALTMRELGETAVALDKKAEAEDYFRQALEIAAQTQSTPLGQDILTGTAVVISRAGQKERAAALLDLVFAEPFGDPFTAKRANQLMEELLADDPTAAEARGHKSVQPGALWEEVGRLLREGNIL